MRRRIYEIIEVAGENDRASRLYDLFMIAVIFASIIPLTIKNYGNVGVIVEKVCVIIFIIDYLMRLFTADFKYKTNKKIIAFLRYPFSIMAIIDLLSILPSITTVNQGFRLLRLLRMIQGLRVFRVFKALRYSKSLNIIKSVLRNSKSSLFAVCTLAVIYILISALLIFNVEPETFGTFFDAIYWATMSLTTVGYGDIYPITTVGKVITMLSSIFGIAIIALPSGIITAGYMNEINRGDKDKLD